LYNNDFYSYNNYGYQGNLFNRLSGLASKTKLNWHTVLNNTQKTLNLINQAIPVIYQIKPIYNNAKTIFRVMNSVREVDKPIIKKSNNQEDILAKKRKEEITNSNVNANKNSNSPTFFL